MTKMLKCVKKCESFYSKLHKFCTSFHTPV
nr:MAG TPA: hypothetical protein [Caudoviricetes sp.]